MNDRLQLAQSYFCWWPCVDSLTPAAYDEAWVVPSLPNLRLNFSYHLLLLFLSLLVFPPLLLTLFHFFSIRPHFCFFLPFLSVVSTSFSHTVPSPSLPHVVLPNFPSPLPLVCVGLTSEGDGQGESEVPDWLEEVEEGGSDWLNGFFTFLYGLINPMESLEEEEHSTSGGVVEAQEEEEDEEDEDEGGVRRRGTKDDGNRGQKIVIVGLHNQ